MEELQPREQLDVYVSQLLAPQTEVSEVFEQATGVLTNSELSLLLEALPIEQRFQCWQELSDELQASVLVGMRAQARRPVLDALEPVALEQLLQQLDAEGLIELSDNLSDEQVDRAYHYLDEKQKLWYRDSSQFGEDQIGRYAEHGLISRLGTTRAGDALRALRRTRLKDASRIYVLEKGGAFLGTVRLAALLRVRDENQPLVELLEPDQVTLNGVLSLQDAAELIERSEAPELPVVDDQQHLIGCVSPQTALWIQREEFEYRLMAQAGMDESTDLFVPVVRGARQRALWLGINLLTAFLAAWTIGLFAEVLSQVVALAVLMPVVASMGGIAGSQTLTLIIRGLATKQVTFGNSLALSRQELSIAALNGVGWGLVIGLVTLYWFDSHVIGLIIGIAVLANIVVAALSGVYIPLLLDKFRFDPALSGAVVLTTVTDVVGFVTFLGLATLLIL